MHVPMPEGNPCFFCEIANGSTHQWQIVDEDELTMTLLNGRQFEIGQCVVIPRRHVRTLLDLESLEGSAVMAAAKRVARALVHTYSPAGVLLYQNNGIGSGQEVSHFHLHVVPRQPERDWGFGPPHLERLEREGRLRHQEHLMVTDEKRQAVSRIRLHL
jgi:diadenosine tetraphosphate (Ap4A) HIT family hydrolase